MTVHELKCSSTVSTCMLYLFVCVCVALVTPCTFVHVNTHKKYKPSSFKRSVLMQGYVSLTFAIVLLINDMLWLICV